MVAPRGTIARPRTTTVAASFDTLVTGGSKEGPCRPNLMYPAVASTSLSPSRARPSRIAARTGLPTDPLIWPVGDTPWTVELLARQLSGHGITTRQLNRTGPGGERANRRGIEVEQLHAALAANGARLVIEPVAPP